MRLCAWPEMVDMWKMPKCGERKGPSGSCLWWNKTLMHGVSNDTIFVCAARVSLKYTKNKCGTNF